MNSSYLVLICVAFMVVTCWGFNRRQKLSGYKERRCFDSDNMFLSLETRPKCSPYTGDSVSLEELAKTHPGLLKAVNYPVLRSSDFSA
jgi:hypothetical protein